MSKNKFITPLLVLFSPCFIFAQNMSDLYKKADNYGESFRSKYYYGAYNVQSIEDSHNFTYYTNTPKGTEYYLIDADKRVLNSAFDQERLATALADVLDKEVEAYKLPISQVVINKQLDTLYFSINNKDYYADLSKYTVKEKTDKEDSSPYYWGRTHKEDLDRKVTSPDEKKMPIYQKVIFG